MAIQFTALEAVFEANAKPFVEESQRAGAATESFNSVLLKLGGILAGVFAIDRIKDFASAAITEYAEQEMALSRLTLALKLHGDTTGEQVIEVKKQIDAIRSLTTATDTEITRLFAFGSSLGINTKELKAASMAALDMAAAFGVDAEMAMRAMKNATDGQTGSLSRLGMRLKQNEGEALSWGEVITQVQANVAGQAEAMTKTLGGQLKIMENEWGEAKQNIGGLISDIIKNMGLLDTGKSYLTWIKDSTKDWDSFGRAMTEALGSKERWDGLEAGLKMLISHLGEALQVAKDLTIPFQLLFRMGEWVGQKINKNIMEQQMPGGTSLANLPETNLSDAWLVGESVTPGGVARRLPGGPVAPQSEMEKMLAMSPASVAIKIEAVTTEEIIAKIVKAVAETAARNKWNLGYTGAEGLEYENAWQDAPRLGL
jgi:hypothetical protein